MGEGERPACNTFARRLVSTRKLYWHFVRARGSGTCCERAGRAACVVAYMTDYGMRVCSRCGAAKSLEHYYRDRTKADGLEHSCKSCRSLARADHRGTTQRPRKNALWRRALLPVLAARLCAAVHGEAVPPLPPGCQDVELISAAAWQQAVLLICQGVSPETALRRVGIPRDLLAACCRYEPRLKASFGRAKLAARRRNQPSVLAIDAVLSELLRNPTMSLRTACAKHGVDYRGCLARTKEPELEPRYLRIREMQQDLAFDDLISEVDQISNTRAAGSHLARQINALKTLEPQRLRPRKPKTARAYEDDAKAPEAASPPDKTDDSNTDIPSGAGISSVWREES